MTELVSGRGEMEPRKPATPAAPIPPDLATWRRANTEHYEEWRVLTDGGKLLQTAGKEFLEATDRLLRLAQERGVSDAALNRVASMTESFGTAVEMRLVKWMMEER